MSNENLIANHTPGKRLAGLDVLRSIAIISVVFFHFGLGDGAYRISFFQNFGWTGVDLFFVLSGFLIAGQIFGQLKSKQQFSVRQFYLRRAFRILPAYWPVLLIYALWPAFRENHDFAPLWRFLSFTHNLNLDRNLYKTFSQSWSLCVEEHFYLFFPLLTLLILRYTRPFRNAIIAFISLFLIGFTFRLIIFQIKIEPLVRAGADVGHEFLRWIYYPTYTRLDGLLFGVVLASIQFFVPPLWKRLVSYRWVYFGFGLSFLAIAYQLKPNTFTMALLAYPLISLGFALLIPAAVTAPFFSKVPGSKPIAELAFTIYLTHKQVFHLTKDTLQAFGWSLSPLKQLIAALPLVILTAWILHQLVELPLLNMRDQLVKAYRKPMVESEC